jgi:hypothetical protein
MKRGIIFLGLIILLTLTVSTSVASEPVIWSEVEDTFLITGLFGDSIPYSQLVDIEGLVRLICKDELIRAWLVELEEMHPVEVTLLTDTTLKLIVYYEDCIAEYTVYDPDMSQWWVF